MQPAIGFILATIVWLVTAIVPRAAVAASKPPTELARHLTSIASLATSSPMQTVPAGEFVLGSKRIDDDPYGLRTQFDDTELPQNRVWLDAYAMDRDEVSLGEYLTFLQQRKQYPSDELQKLIWHVITVHSMSDQTLTRWPALYVTWDEAKDFCRTREKRLPTEAEWEKAAEEPTVACFLGGRRRRRQSLPCSGNTTSMRSRFSRRWIHTMTAEVPTVFITWPAMSQNGFTTGSGLIITPTCRNEILPARPAGATRASGAARGRANLSCSARPHEAARSRTNDPPRSVFVARNPLPPTASHPA